jgi:superfamily II DNA or RNA helicase
MIRQASQLGKRILFLVNRRDLVKDLSRRLFRMGVKHGIIMAGHPPTPWRSVQVASIDTLYRRNIDEFDLCFVDETHFALSPTFLKVINSLGSCVVIGMTATPIRVDGRGLGELYEVMVRCPDTPELIERGYLVPPRVFAPNAPDLSGVKTTAGEYNQKQLANAVDRSAITGDIVAHWLKFGRGRPTVGFAVTVEHSKHMAEQFVAAGIRAVHVDADTPDEERDRIWAGLTTGEVEVAFNVGIAGYGWDEPCVSCMIEARPTQSLALWLQHCGRVLRTHASKTDAIILDHAGNTLRHGLPDEPRDWTLEGAKKKRSTKPDRALELRTCRNCWGVFSTRLTVCPHYLPDGSKCGAEYTVDRAEVRQTAGDLEEVKSAARYVCDRCARDMEGDLVCACGGFPKRAYRIKKLSDDPVVAKLQKIAEERGYKPGWVYHQRLLAKSGQAVSA